MNIDKINLPDKKEGIDRINQIIEMPIIGKNLLPKPIKYIDIDMSMTDFIDKNFNIKFGEIEIKTFFFAQQRMNELSKTWEVVDDNKNILPNFKIVTRENNPKPGTLQNGLTNIPSDKFFTLGTFESVENNKKIIKTCKMRQPYCVDLIYNIKFVTNRLNLLNDLNNQMINKFKSKQSYIIVNGHYMPVLLEDVGDESIYELDERKIFIQNFQIKVLGYIINEDDIKYENTINRLILTTYVDNLKSKNKISKDNNNNIIAEFPRKFENILLFKSDDFYNVSGLTSTNVNNYKIYINGIIVTDNNFFINKYDRIKIQIERINKLDYSKIILITE